MHRKINKIQFRNLDILTGMTLCMFHVLKPRRTLINLNENLEHSSVSIEAILAISHFDVIISQTYRISIKTLTVERHLGKDLAE